MSADATPPRLAPSTAHTIGEAFRSFVAGIELPAGLDEVAAEFTKLCDHVLDHYGRSGLDELGRLAAEWQASGGAPLGPVNPPERDRTPKWLTTVAQEVILYAVKGDPDAVLERLRRIATDGGSVAMYAACVGWATAAGGYTGLAQQIRDTGADGVAMIPIEGQQLDESDPDLFAVRFLTCILNNDQDTAYALFMAPIEAGDAERHQACVIALVAMVGQAGREKQAQDARDRVRHAGGHDRRPPGKRRVRRRG